MVSTEEERCPRGSMRAEGHSPDACRLQRGLWAKVVGRRGSTTLVAPMPKGRPRIISDLQNRRPALLAWTSVTDAKAVMALAASIGHGLGLEVAALPCLYE